GKFCVPPAGAQKRVPRRLSAVDPCSNHSFVPRPRPAILFDLDGTLLDSIELILASARYAFGKLGRECPPDAEWLHGVGIPLFTMFGRYARDDGDRVALIAAYREHQFANHDRLVGAYDGIHDLLSDLRPLRHDP